MSKKTNERKVLDETLALARKRGGESRRNIDRISGTISEGERPDFIVTCNKKPSPLSQVIAIEHFRVDHFSETNKRNGHQDSLAAKEKARADKIQRMWNPTTFDTDIPSDVLNAVGTSFAKCLEAKFEATYSGYVKSFTNALRKHAQKLDTYRENARTHAPHGTKIDLGLLVELHSDFTGSFVHVNGTCHKAEAGELLLFDEMVNELESLGESIDYIIIGSYEGLRNEIVDAAAVRQTTLALSLKRNKLKVFEYLGEDKEMSIYGKTQITPTATQGEDKIDFALERRSQGMSTAEHINACLNMLPKAIKAYRAKQPFVTTIAMQMFLENYADVLPSKARYNWSDIDIVRKYLGEAEVARREQRFMSHYFPDQIQQRNHAEKINAL